MSTGQADAVVLQVTAEDFDRLCENSGIGSIAVEQPGRFEAMNYPEPPSSTRWHWTYWLGDNYTTVILARAFLAARGFGYEVLYDTAEHPNGRLYGYVILTDYENDRSAPGAEARPGTGQLLRLKATWADYETGETP